MATPPTEWKTWSLTHVYYPKGDHYGKRLAIFTLLPHCLMVAFFTLSLFVRDIHVILFFAGQIANEVFNTVLKKIVAEGRPEQIPGQPNVNSSYGWPSSHCQFQAFFFVYSTFLIVHRLLVPKKRSAFFCYFLILVNSIALIFIVHSRIYLRFHFLHQCVHGLAIGSAFALFWYLLVNFILEPLIMEPLMKTKLNNVLELCSIYCNRATPKADKSSNVTNGKKKPKSK